MSQSPRCWVGYPYILDVIGKGIAVSFRCRSVYIIKYGYVNRLRMVFFNSNLKGKLSMEPLCTAVILFICSINVLIVL